MIRIENLLSREIGLSAASIGNTAIEIAVKTRMRQTGCDDFERYASGLQFSADELRSLIEQIVVSETWFFRDAAVFRTLLEHVNRTRSQGRATRVLRVLSIPCATGEEAYSISMTLLDGGLSPDQFRIQAFDVSENAIQAARRGIYGKNSFRGEPLGDRVRFFEVLSSGDLQVADAARASVTVAQGNLLDGALLPNHSQVDVIFCRNVLIYLDRNARTRALDNLLRWLAADGILFAGHAEALDRMDPRIRRLDSVSNFAYARRSEAQQPEPSSTGAVVTRPVKAAPELRRPPAALRTKLRPGPATAQGSAPERPAEAAPVSEALAQVARLADRGDLAAAARECEGIIARSGASDEAYCLLGVVRKASGDAEAALACFTKALYLNRQHYESLVLVALIHEQRGDHASASNFRRRAERLRQGVEK